MKKKQMVNKNRSKKVQLYLNAWLKSLSADKCMFSENILHVSIIYSSTASQICILSGIAMNFRCMTWQAMLHLNFLTLILWRQIIRRTLVERSCEVTFLTFRRVIFWKRNFYVSFWNPTKCDLTLSGESGSCFRLSLPLIMGF